MILNSQNVSIVAPATISCSLWLSTHHKLSSTKRGWKFWLLRGISPLLGSCLVFSRRNAELCGASQFMNNVTVDKRSFTRVDAFNCDVTRFFKQIFIISECIHFLIQNTAVFSQSPFPKEKLRIDLCNSGSMNSQSPAFACLRSCCARVCVHHGY